MLAGVKVAQFLFSPAGRVVLIALSFLAWGAYQRHDATKDCQEEELRRQLAESQRQLVIAQQIATEARRRADQRELEVEELRDLANEITEDVEGSGCSIDDATVEQLRRIR